MKEKLQLIQKEALSSINAPEANLEEIRIKYLGKKGELTSILRGMGALSSEERPIVGHLANEVLSSIEAAIKEKAAELAAKELEDKLIKEKIDVTVPGKAPATGHIHPLTAVQRELENIFIGMQASP